MVLKWIYRDIEGMSSWIQCKINVTSSRVGSVSFRPTEIPFRMSKKKKIANERDGNKVNKIKVNQDGAIYLLFAINYVVTYP